MLNRDIDVVKGDNSLYACISKEIFGREDQADLIEKLVAKEMVENLDVYINAVVVQRSMKGRGNNVQIQNIDQTLIPFLLVFGDLPLLAAATLFQTAIYVLSCEPGDTMQDPWKSSWSSFTQVRRKKRPTVMPNKQSKCRRQGTANRYYVTLLRDPYGNFSRIVPKDQVCNCQIERPSIPGVVLAECHTSQTSVDCGGKYFKTLKIPTLSILSCIYNVAAVRYNMPISKNEFRSWRFDND